MSCLISVGELMGDNVCDLCNKLISLHDDDLLLFIGLHKTDDLFINLIDERNKTSIIGSVVMLRNAIAMSKTDDIIDYENEYIIMSEIGSDNQSVILKTNKNNIVKIMFVVG